MGKLIVCNLMSLDGFVSGPDGNVMVMPFDNGFSDYNAERLRTAAAMVLGRKTFEFFRAYWPAIADDGEQPAVEREISRLNTAAPKLVVTDSLQSGDLTGWGPARAVTRQNASAEITKLKAETAGDVLVFGSHTMWNALLRDGLVDELHLMIGPGLVRKGAPAFETDMAGKLKLLDTRRFDNSSLVLLTYSVNR